MFAKEKKKEKRVAASAEAQNLRMSIPCQARRCPGHVAFSLFHSPILYPFLPHTLHILRTHNQPSILPTCILDWTVILAYKTNSEALLGFLAVSSVTGACGVEVTCVLPHKRPQSALVYPSRDSSGSREEVLNSDRL